MRIKLKKLIIQGGAKLKGTVRVSGSKNATLPIMAAAILADTPSVINKIPLVTDIFTMAELLQNLGAGVDLKQKQHSIKISPESINNFKAPYELVKKMRASIYVLGPLVAKYKKAKVSMPGGCAIGLRPIDLHIKGIKKLGAKIEIRHGYVIAEAKKLKGAKIIFDKVSVGATVNCLLAAVLAKGTSVFENVSKEPEVVDTVNFLKKMGADIKGEGTSTLIINGVEKLKGIEYEVIPDRIEAATLIAAAVMTRGDVVVENIVPEHLDAFFEKLKEAGAKFEIGKNFVHILPYKNKLKAVDIITEPYPGFPTDIQAQWMALMTLAKGDSIIKETIWENRFMHVLELNRMGADITIQGNTAVVSGINKLSAADVMASDLRASAALIIAGLMAEGKTVVRRIYHLERGYEKFYNKLKKLGARLKIKSEKII